MWSKPWSYKEGLTIGTGLLIIGILLQMTVGAINWDLFACPVNVIVLVVYIIALIVMHLLRKRVYLFSCGRHDGSYGTYPASSFRSCSKCFNGFAGILTDDCILAFRSALLLDGHCIGTDDTSCQLSF